MRRRRVVRVPASSANLGPGFDVLAAALALHVELEVVETGTFAVVTDLDLPLGRENLVVRGFERLRPADDFEFRIRSSIPLTGGLGSSAAATVAGLVAADSLFELDADLFAHAAALEGHPDNVGAALHGGIVLCAGGEVTALEVPSGLETVVVVPHEAVQTAAARAALPAEIPMGDAVHAIAHAGLLVAGLSTGRWDLIARGLDDRIHQPRRAHLFPRSAELLGRVREWGALGATISGAGPSVLVWTQYDMTTAVMRKLRDVTAGWADVLHAPLEAVGADVRAM